MPAERIDGKAIAAQVNAETALEISELEKKYGCRPVLAVILVGNDPASEVYVSRKEKKCQELGILSKKILLPQDTAQETLLNMIRELNADKTVHGILVQAPVPPQINEKDIVNAIDPAKDVDCFHPANVGRVMMGEQDGFLPCTPWGICVLLERSGISAAGKNVVVLGRSNIVGKPMAALLMNKSSMGNATVTVCHSRTKDLASFTRRADIIIAAIGQPQFLKADMVSEGTVVIDVGINRVPKPDGTGTKLVGDVDFEGVSAKASLITPVPGGVGPMTIAMLMKNTVRAFRKSFDVR